MMNLFYIYSKRFSKEMAALVELTNSFNSFNSDSEWYREKLIEKINVIFQDNPNLDEIIRFVNDVFKSRQYIHYFRDPSYLVFEEISADTKPEDIDRELCKKMIENMQYSEEMVEKVKKIYPKH